jgi:Rrf2 family iron-sulfur cluster assembly transcriptional regulator
MRLRSQTSAALRALLDLSLHSAYHAPVPVSDIAKRQGVSVAFLEQLFRSLKKAGLVAPWRGMKGGYTLKSPAEEITLLQVFQALDEPVVRKYGAAQAGQSAEEQALRTAVAALEGDWAGSLAKLSLAQLRKSAQKNPKLQGSPRAGAGFSI